jgi:hypothetical protein
MGQNRASAAGDVQQIGVGDFQASDYPEKLEAFQQPSQAEQVTCVEKVGLQPMQGPATGQRPARKCEVMLTCADCGTKRSYSRNDPQAKKAEYVCRRCTTKRRHRNAT